jgi:TolA-binding protein
MSQQTINFPPAMPQAQPTTSTKRTRNEQLERDTPIPSGTTNTLDQLREHIQVDVGNMFIDQDARMRSYFSKLLTDIIIDMQKQHEQQLLSLQNDVASLRTTVARLERVQQPTTQQQTNNQTPTDNANNGQQGRGRSTARTPNPTRETSRHGNRNASTSGKRVTYANQAAKPPTATQPTTPTRKQEPTKLLSAKYPKADREIIISFNAPIQKPDNIPAQLIADRARIEINKVLTDSKDIAAPPFLASRITANQNIVLTTGLNCNGMDYKAYLPLIAATLSHLGTATATINERWTKFLLHNVPTTLSPNELRQELETHYPDLRLAQTPRWLKKPEERAKKTASAAVIAVLGSIQLANIGLHKLLIANRSCKIEPYFEYASWTQCHKCQKLGHPQELCKEQHFTCGVCAQPHATSDHPCHMPYCKKGPACTHPPIKCAICSGNHKAMDRNCPTRVQAYEAWKTRNTNTNTAPPATNDDPMQQ